MKYKLTYPESAPFREPLGYSKRPVKSSYEVRRKYHSCDYTFIGHYGVYAIIDRILTKYIGKDVNEAFSHYCKLVPKYLQFEFWNKLFPKVYHRVEFGIDENNCIQYKVLKEPRTIFKIRTYDYHFLSGTGGHYTFNKKDSSYYKCWYEERNKKRKLKRELNKQK